MHCVTKNFISLHQHSRICEGRCESLSLCGCGVFAILSYTDVILSQTPNLPGDGGSRHALQQLISPAYPFW